MGGSGKAGATRQRDAAGKGERRGSNLAMWQYYYKAGDARKKRSQVLL